MILIVIIDDLLLDLKVMVHKEICDDEMNTWGWICQEEGEDYCEDKEKYL